MEKLRHGTFAADFSIFTDYFGLAAILPVISFFITDDLEESSEWIGIILSVQYVGVILGTFIFGLLGDSFSKKSIMTFVMIGECICCFLSAFTVSVEYLLIVRFAAGVFSPQISLAWVNQIVNVNDSTKAIGRWSAFGIIGFLAGTAAGGSLSMLGWFYINIATCVLAALSSFIVILHKDTPTDNKTTRVDNNIYIPSIYRSYSFLLIVLSNFSAGIKTSFSTTIPAIILMNVFDWTPAMVSILYFIAACGYLLVHGFALPRLVNTCQFSSIAILIWTTLVDSVINLLFLVPQVFSAPFHPGWIAYVSLTVATSWMTPLELGTANLLGGDFSRAHQDQSGSILGIARSLYVLGMAVSPFVAIMLLTEFGLTAPFIGIASWMFVSGVAMMIMNYLNSNK